jgi:hypothetical protein
MNKDDNSRDTYAVPEEGIKVRRNFGNRYPSDVALYLKRPELPDTQLRDHKIFHSKSLSLINAGQWGRQEWRVFMRLLSILQIYLASAM